MSYECPRCGGDIAMETCYGCKKTDELDRLRAELAWYKDNVRCTDEGPCACNYRAVTAEARLAAVIALCDATPDRNLNGFEVRAAATGDNQ